MFCVTFAAMMHSITLRQLRDTRQIKEWLEAGVHIEVRDRNRVIGDFVPRTPPTTAVEWPDFAARRKAIFGNRMLTPVADLIADRESSRY
jgi:antitoxin (DNA-binding transcriptional repressor) of toxin-antitoxin stability system